MRSVSLVAILAGCCLAACSGPIDSPEQPQAGEPPDSTAAERAFADLVAAYEELTGMIDSGSEQAVDRVQEDFENLGDWEYQIIDLPGESPDEIAESLNALGDERWEAYWVERSPGLVRIYLKRPAVSYVSRVPLSALLRLLAAGA